MPCGEESTAPAFLLTLSTRAAMSDVMMLGDFLARGDLSQNV